MFYLYVNKYVA